MDPRETPFNGRVAHVSLKGQVAAEAFRDGTPHDVTAPVTPITDAGLTRRERELVFGERFLVLDRAEGYAFGMAARDGYVGHVAECDLGPPTDSRHLVGVARSYAKPTPDLKRFEPVVQLSFAARVTVEGTEGDWSAFQMGDQTLWMPTAHLRPLDTPAADPVETARLFLGTPYLWGGNSAFGIDCSGLIQAAMLACGIACPGDSDQQETRLGDEIPPNAASRRGDLYFWNGHVGILSDPGTLLHANAHHMATAEEPLADAIARIKDREGKAVTCRRRVALPS